MLSKLTPLLSDVTARVGDLPTIWEALSGGRRGLVILTAFGTLFALEACCACRRQEPHTVRQSYFANLGLMILNDTLMSLLSMSSLWFIAERYARSGLLSGVSDPGIRIIVSFLLLDLTLYFWHRASHCHDALWMWHKVHHSDRCMNVSTAFRLHGAEIVLTTLVKAVFIVVVGVDAKLLLANEAVITLFVLFHHANIAFPLERRLGEVLVVPRLHRIHHSTQRSEHDHNYAAVFSFWDRLFGTFADSEPLELGLPNAVSANLVDLVKHGLPWSTAPAADKVRTMIAEAAYYRAEKRGFAPGDDFADWLEAERVILNATVGPMNRWLDADSARKWLECLRMFLRRRAIRSHASSCPS